MINLEGITRDTENLKQLLANGDGKLIRPRIEKNYDNSLPEIEILQADIGRVLLNIINNACYALSEKQQEKDKDFNPKLSVSTTTKGKTIEIRIHDNGNGIPEKIREKIFNPFFTTKPAGTGNSGLGLSISYDIIVLQHYGKLTVDSKPGEFSNTYFLLTHVLI